jgi:hypothetical protein
MVEFDATIFVTEQLNRELVNISQDFAYRIVKVLADHYKFDSNEAIEMLGINMLKVERKKSKVESKVEKQAIKIPKPAFPMPWSGELNETCCYALCLNNGLYTQCTSSRNEEEEFCKACVKKMQKKGSEFPDYGTIHQRMSVGIYEYVDPKGKKPIAYTKLMNKYKITEEDVIKEASKFNITINPEHFVVPETKPKRGRPSKSAITKKDVRGRPKKIDKVVEIEGQEEDLFASLVASANAEGMKKNKEVEKEAEKEAEKETEKEAEKEAEKETEKEIEKEIEKEAEKETEKETETEKEIEKEAKKAEKEAKKAEKEAKKAEKEAELKAKKAEKEAEKEAKKAEKEAELKAKKAEKEAEKEAKKAEKEAKKAEKEAKKAEKETENKTSKVVVTEPNEDEEPDVVKKIEFEGKQYLKSKKTGIVYDYKKYVIEGDQVVIGKWCNNTNKIIFNMNDESEEEDEEEDYDE